MPATSPSSHTTRQSGNRASKRRASAKRAAAEAARLAVQRRRRTRWTGVAVAVVVLAVAAVVIVLATRGNDAAGPPVDAGAAPVVGGDLHTVTAIGDRLFVGGHEAVAVSRDGGKRWQQVDSLQGADAMGWAQTPDAVLVGGHPGLYRSADGGNTFTKVTGDGAVDDVHALGGAGTTLYLASPSAGLLASTDGGRTWQERNAQTGGSFMGTILVDPTNPATLIAPDMRNGLMRSTDAGRTWTPLGGPMGAMALAANPQDLRRIIAVGMNGGELSTDGGVTWTPTTVPPNTSAVGYDPNGTVYAGALDGDTARVFRSTDGGGTWNPTT